MRNTTLAMDRFGKAFWMELRLLAGNWVYPLLHLLWVSLLVWMFFGRDDRSAQALLETTLGRIAIGMISLVGLFLAGISASRSRQVKFLDLEDSFPIGFEVTTGRWLAGLLTLILFLAEPLAVAALQGPPSSLIDELPRFVREAGLTIAFTTAFAWALMTWLKSVRWTYPLLAAGWLGFLLGPTMLTDSFPFASLLNFMRQGVSFYSELWGRLVYGDQSFWFNLFYTGLLLLCLGVLTLSFSVRRFHKLFLSGVVLMVGALLLAGLGGTRYVADIQAAQAAPVVGVFPAEPSHFTVSDYHLTLDLNNPKQPCLTAEITAVNNGLASLDVLAFRLNPALTITDASLQVERSSDLVQVHLPEPLAPGEDLSLTLQYEGKLRLESVSEGVIEASDFTDPIGVRLTPGANWYPVPASLAQTPGLHDPARIRLAVTNSGDLPFAANLPAVGENIFEADAVGWIFLIGSPRLVFEQLDEVTLITSQADLARARELASVYVNPLRTIAPFFPEADIQGLILMVLGEEGGLPEDTPPVAGYPLVITQRYSLANMATSPDFSRLFVLRALTADLWRMSGGVLDPEYNGPVTSLDNAFDAVVGFLGLYVKENGDAARMLTELQNATQAQGGINENRLALLEIYVQGGEEAVIGVLREMYLHPDELRALPYDSLPQWIREAGRGQ